MTPHWKTAWYLSNYLLPFFDGGGVVQNFYFCEEVLIADGVEGLFEEDDALPEGFPVQRLFRNDGLNAIGLP